MLKIDHSKKFPKSFKIDGNLVSFYKEAKYRICTKYLVLHHIAASSVDHAIDQLKDHGVSCHYLIDENGSIYQLVDDENVAFHAGSSYWAGDYNLNDKSIGIEFINSDPFAKSFEKRQLQEGVLLINDLIKRYKFLPKNIVGHSDIAYDPQTKNLNRKQDPSHLFDWSYLARNGIGCYPNNSLSIDDLSIYDNGVRSDNIRDYKKLLSDFGYLVSNISDECDQELLFLTRVFNRRFLNIDLEGRAFVPNLISLDFLS